MRFPPAPRGYAHIAYDHDWNFIKIGTALFLPGPFDERQHWQSATSWAGCVAADVSGESGILKVGLRDGDRSQKGPGVLRGV